MVENSVRRRNDTKNEVSEKTNSQPTSSTQPKETAEFRYGPLPTFQNQKVWTRAVLAVCTVAIVYFSAKRGKEQIFASQKQTYDRRGHDIPCSDSYMKEITGFKGCIPKSCGRAVSDTLITKGEAETMLNIALQGMALGGSDGGACILDLHSGALSAGANFVNFYRLPESADILKPSDFLTYKIVRTKIQQAIAYHFGIDTKSLFLTHPTFFSRLANNEPKTVHDEYWHKHVDKETYESFHYTSLLYLNNFHLDFEGGRFVFANSDNSTSIVEPRQGRVSMFTSGAENPHWVERVTSGTRYAMTVSFTCDKNRAIADPQPFKQ